MSDLTYARATEICQQVADDAAADASNFDGKPFTGKTVAEYFGNHGASIAALANLTKVLINQVRYLESVRRVGAGGMPVEDTDVIR